MTSLVMLLNAVCSSKSFAASSSSRFLYLLWLCCCVSLVSADYGLSVFTDVACTQPYTGVPAVLNTHVPIVMNQSVCVPGNSFSPQWIPSPAATVQWVAYSCQISPTGTGRSLFVSSWAYSSPSGVCPYNVSSATSYSSANSSGIAFTSNRNCQVFQWSQWNTNTQSNNVSYLYATFSCSNVATGGSSSAGHSQTTLPQHFVAHASLTLALAISLVTFLN